MLEEEASPPIPRRAAVLALESLGIEELRSYIDELHAEIIRVEVVIERKKTHLGAAERLFRS